MIIVMSELVKKVGLNEAIFLSIIVRHVLVDEKNNVDIDGYTQLSVEEIKEYTLWTENEQEEIIKSLLEQNAIEVKIMEQSNKRYFKAILKIKDLTV